jgi:hypothetical protein
MALKRTLFTGTVYTIDMSAIKDLHERYPKNLFPTIWHHIDSLIHNSQLVSHIEVHREIKGTTNAQDKLLLWSNKNRKIFQSIDTCQNSKIPEIQSKYNKGEWQNKMNRPGPWADPYLIAMAMCEGATILTQESKTKANRIPPIGNQLGVRSLNLLEFFEELKIKL